MARYIEDAKISQPLDAVSEIMQAYIYRNQFTRTDWKGEPVYVSRAQGSERYFKWSYTSGIIHIEAWLKGTFGEEAGLNGIGGAKKDYKTSIEELLKRLHQPIKDEYSQPAYNQQPAQTYSKQPQQPTQTYSKQPQQPAQTYSKQPSQQPTYTSNWMNNQAGKPFTQPAAHTEYRQTAYTDASANAATNAAADAQKGFMMGILAVIFAFIFPIFGVVFGISGLKKCSNSMNFDSTGKAKMGKICCIAAIVIAGILFLINFLLPFFLMFWM